MSLQGTSMRVTFGSLTPTFLMSFWGLMMLAVPTWWHMIRPTLMTGWTHRAFLAGSLKPQLVLLHRYVIQAISACFYHPFTCSTT